MAKMEKIGNMQVVDNKVDSFFCFPMISMVCTGSGYREVDLIKSTFFYYQSILMLHEKSYCRARLLEIYLYFIDDCVSSGIYR